MWTYNWLLRLSGDTSWCDLIESVFVNAGPGSIARDFKTMSYYQQPNRISEHLPTCPPVPGRGDCTFTDHGHTVLCCVGSSNWTIPNYVGNMWQATMDGGLAYLLYGPCCVSTVMGKPRVTLDCTTAYPFEETINVKVSLSEPLTMPLYFHIPSWCGKMSVCVNGRRQKVTSSDGLLRIEREWKDGDTIGITLPMEVTLTEEFDWNPTQAQPMPKDKVSDCTPATITLVPYNLTKFRISMFPVAD